MTLTQPEAKGSQQGAGTVHRSFLYDSFSIKNKLDRHCAV